MRALPTVPLVLGCLLAACGSESEPNSPEPPAPPDAPPASVRLFDAGSGAELTPAPSLVSGSTVRVNAHFFDSLGAQVTLEAGETASLVLGDGAFGTVTPVGAFPALWDVTVDATVDATSSLTVGFEGDDTDEVATFGPMPVTAIEGAAGPITLRFRADVSGIRFRCDTTITLGTPATGGARTKDFRFYVHDVRLLTASGREVPVSVPDDGAWQQAGTALLDFEDATGLCAQEGDPETRDVVTGTAPTGEFAGLAFTMGIPFTPNHANFTTATAPFDRSAMFWSWNEGRKFLRADVDAPSIGSFRIHLGSTGCDGGSDTNPPTTCSTPNRVAVRLTGFNPRLGTVVADLADLMQDTHINSNTVDTPAGCTSFPDDPDCAGMFGRLGLPFGGAPAGTQQFFHAEGE